MEYQVVTDAETTAELEKEVNALIKDGWKPQGGVLVYYFAGNGRVYKCQAMIKE